MMIYFAVKEYIDPMDGKDRLYRWCFSLSTHAQVTTWSPDKSALVDLMAWVGNELVPVETTIMDKSARTCLRHMVLMDG